MAAAARTSGTRSPLASTLYRGSTVSAISRAEAIARALASFALRVCERSAEYTARCAAFFVAAERTAVTDFAVRVRLAAASVGAAAILTRQRSARGPIQKYFFLLTWADPGLWLEEVRKIV